MRTVRLNSLEIPDLALEPNIDDKGRLTITCPTPKTSGNINEVPLLLVLQDETVRKNLENTMKQELIKELQSSGITISAREIQVGLTPKVEGEAKGIKITLSAEATAKLTDANITIGGPKMTQVLERLENKYDNLCLDAWQKRADGWKDKGGARMEYDPTPGKPGPDGKSDKVIIQFDACAAGQLADGIWNSRHQAQRSGIGTTAACVNRWSASGEQSVASSGTVIDFQQALASQRAMLGGAGQFDNLSARTATNTDRNALDNPQNPAHNYYMSVSRGVQSLADNGQLALPQGVNARDVATTLMKDGIDQQRGIDFSKASEISVMVAKDGRVVLSQGANHDATVNVSARLSDVQPGAAAANASAITEKGQMQQQHQHIAQSMDEPTQAAHARAR